MGIPLPASTFLQVTASHPVVILNIAFAGKKTKDESPSTCCYGKNHYKAGHGRVGVKGIWKEFSVFERAVKEHEALASQRLLGRVL